MPTMVSESNVIERRLWSSDEFLDWLQPGVHADLIDGEKFMHSPVSLRHARLLNFLDRLMGLYIEAHDLGVLYRECVAVRLGSRNTFLPDLCFLTNEQSQRAGEAIIPFAPTLVVEVLSSATADRDIGPKFSAYEEHGVLEYWVLDPDTQAHRFYARDGELLVEFDDHEPVVRARCLDGFAVRRDWLGPTHPKVADAFRALNDGL